MGKVDAQRADLVTAYVVNDRVRDANLPAGGRNPGELAYMGAGEIRLDRRLAVIHQQVLHLRPCVERALVYVTGQLADGLSPDGALVGPLDGGDGVAAEIGGIVGALNKGVDVFLHHRVTVCSNSGAADLPSQRASSAQRAGRRMTPVTPHGVPCAAGYPPGQSEPGRVAAGSAWAATGVGSAGWTRSSRQAR
jgi:hypothetical protein